MKIKNIIFQLALSVLVSLSFTSCKKSDRDRDTDLRLPMLDPQPMLSAHRVFIPCRYPILPKARQLYGQVRERVHLATTWHCNLFTHHPRPIPLPEL